ncbi:hypothetical protein ACFP1I_12635 [Dyadobacter subterraneus]|uniref:Uncharacterized protein n=1 Tax=Dyadobacter subterraneus TaxID=2773304 RepID=A0ABR9W9G3_9BACT|nr:hypothetical protein [Dyadobacter subterraneus]MBE9462077.1 hypothetical protein [Dyadobacter subterraneus]
MFTTNPWVTYISVAGPLLAGYYLLIGIIFYRHSLKARVHSWRSPPVSVSEFTQAGQAEDHSQKRSQQPESELTGLNEYQQEDDYPLEASWENEPMMLQLEELSLHLKQTIREVYEKDYDKEEFILLTQMTLKEYPAIYGTPFQLSINHLIEAELEKYGSIHLDSEDRMRIWNQAD